MAWCALVTYVRASFSYVVEAEFESVPANDDAFEKAIKQQPHYAVVIVNRTPVGPRVRIEVIIIMTQNLRYDPPFVPPDALAAELGYHNPDGPFRWSPPNRP